MSRTAQQIPDSNSAYTPPTCAAPFAATRRFGDFDELSEAIRGWDLDWRQLDGGPLSADLSQIATEAALLSKVRFSRRFYQRGAAPAGMRTFGLLDHSALETDWCGTNLGRGSMPVFCASGDYEAVSPPGFSVWTLSFPEAHLASLARTLGLPALDEFIAANAEVAACDPAALDQVRDALREVCARLAAVPDDAGATARRCLDVEIPAALLGILAAGSESPKTPRPPRLRDRAFKRAVDYLDRHACDPATMLEVCEAAGASWRTVNYAFRERFDMTPQMYAKAVRLNGARRQLATLPPAAKVADVANDWGFWHLGKFAADYRAMFGELPSETRAR